MVKIGVTGGVASGKSTLCSFLKDNGMPVLSSDDLAREVVRPGQKAYGQIVAVFGSAVVGPDEELDRKNLRHMITADEDRRQHLEQIVQPAIIRLLKQKMEALFLKGSAVVIAEVPLLFELALEDDFDLSVLVSVERKIQRGRLISRDQVDVSQAEGLMALQMSDKEKQKKADYIIPNNAGLNVFMVRCNQLLKHINTMIVQE